MVAFDTIYTQTSFITSITIDPACPSTLRGPDSNFISYLAGCNSSFSAIDAAGMNAVAHYAPIPPDSVQPVLGPGNTFAADYVHRVQ